MNIMKITKGDKFGNSINDLVCTWISFVEWVKNFLCNHRAENYKESVEKLLKCLQDINANMSINVHFLHSHLHKFPDCWGDVSDALKEQIHNDIKIMEVSWQLLEYQKGL